MTHLLQFGVGVELPGLFCFFKANQLNLEMIEYVNISYNDLMINNQPHKPESHWVWFLCQDFHLSRTHNLVWRWSPQSHFSIKSYLERKSETKWWDLHLLETYLHPPGNLSIYPLSYFKADNPLVKHSPRAVDGLQIDLHLSPVVRLVPALSIALYPLYHAEVSGWSERTVENYQLNDPSLYLWSHPLRGIQRVQSRRRELRHL